jgi:hypothetical protein
MSKVTFLHISDLHFGGAKGAFDLRIVIDALIADLKEWRTKNVIFDAVLFSGDLVLKGEDTDSFEKAITEFIDPVLKAVGLTRNEFFICPGNHDISKKAVVPFVDAGLRAKLETIEQINDFIDNSITAPEDDFANKAAIARTSNYEAFHKALGLGLHVSNNVFYKTRVIDLAGFKVGIACLNSAWRATGDKTDRQFLIIGERAVDRAIEDIQGTDIKVCIHHHPLDWLLDADTAAIENRIYDAFDLVCYGHMHQSNPRYRVSPLSTAFISQSGSLFAGRKWFNGYQIISWDEANRSVELQCQTYFDSRRKFEPANNSPKGMSQFNLGPRRDGTQLTEIEIFLRQGRPVIRAAADNHINFTRAKGETRKEGIQESYVCPPLSIQRENESLIKPETQAERAQRRVDAEALLRCGEHLLIAGAGECGRTSFLHYLAVRASEGVSDQTRIPAVVNFPLLAKSSYEKTLKSYYADANIAPAVMNNAVKMLPWLVLLDDFNGSKSEHLELLRKIHSDFPSHRIVVVANASSRKQGREILGDGLIAVDMEMLPRKSIRQLSKVRFAGQLDTGMEDPAYQLVMKHLTESRLPRTGYMVSLLLWAVEQNNIGETLNEAVLLENLVSFLLGKTNFEAALRNKFDPRAQEFLLQAIAVELRKAGGWVGSNDLMEFVLEYFKSRGLLFGAREVLDEFISCRLLVEQDGHLGFSYPCYQEYFVALNFRQDPKKLESLLQTEDGAELLSYSRELDLWSSLSRHLDGADEALLKFIAKEGLVDNAELPDVSQLAFVGTDISFSRKRVRELLDNAPTKEQIDEILDKADEARTIAPRKRPGEQKTNAVVERGLEGDKQVEEKIQRQRKAMRELALQRSALKILTKIVRNADHEQLDKKAQVTNTVLRLWSAHTLSFINFLDELMTESFAEHMKASGAERFQFTKEDGERISNILKVAFAWLDGSSISALLTSESLREPMKNIAEDKARPEGVRLFAALAYSETWDKLGIELMGKVLHSLRNKVLMNTALQKMLGDYRFQRYRSAQADDFRELIVETEMFVLGTPITSKGQLIASLEKQEQEG